MTQTQTPLSMDKLVERLSDASNFDTPEELKACIAEFRTRMAAGEAPTDSEAALAMLQKGRASIIPHASRLTAEAVVSAMEIMRPMAETSPELRALVAESETCRDCLAAGPLPCQKHLAAALEVGQALADQMNRSAS